ncbi:MAG: glycosyltransferase family 4 protein [Planctomycetota bacterium]|nr:glycosyltransferase family 4 protein [Planctomycetota bacterium]
MEMRVRLAVLITRLVRGGAQKIALETFRRMDPARFDRFFITGPDRGDEGDAFDEAVASGIHPIIVPGLQRAISPAADASAVLRIASLLRRLRIQILHTHTSKAGLLGALAGRWVGTPVIVYSPHGHIFGKGARIPGVSGSIRTRILYRLRRLAERWSDRVIALNDADLQEQVALGLAPVEKYVVIQNGIDLSAYRNLSDTREAARRSLGLANGTPAVAVVGRLTPEKGHDVLIEAFSRLAPDLEPVLLIIGGGPQESELRESSRRLGVESRVRFLGVRRDVPDLLAASDLVVLPSYYESGGLALMEAMAARRPVIASRTGGVPDLVQDGENGLLVPPGQADPLARAMERVLRDPALAERLAAGGHRKVTDHHDIDRSARILQGLYAQLIQEKGLR